MFIKNALRWARKNPEKKMEIEKRRRARKMNNGGNFTKEEWKQIKEKYNNTCLRCNKKEPEIKLTVDHVLPISKGGRHEKGNIQPLCLSCNSGKKDKHIDYRR